MSRFIAGDPIGLDVPDPLPVGGTGPSGSASPTRRDRLRATLDDLGRARRLGWVCLLGLACGALPALRPKLLKRLGSSWYDYIFDFKHHDWIFVNYGYDPADAIHVREGVPDSAGASIQSHQESLYARVAGAVSLLGKDVLEVGCGRGGGAASVVRRFGPRSLVGLDLSKAGVAFCRARHRLDGLSFVQGDAEDLLFLDNSFDVVLNVESSHCYTSASRFLEGVVRVLRPGGFLLLADMRPRTLSGSLRDQFRATGLVIVEEELINDGVVRALEKDGERKLARILARVPRFLHRVMLQFAAIPGTSVFEGLRTGEIEYLRFVLRKPDHGGSSSSQHSIETPGESS